MALAQAVKFSSAMHKAGQAPSVLDRVWLYVGVSCGVAALFVWAGGVYRLVTYVLMSVGVPFLLNTVTYVQHWGLGSDGPAASLKARDLAWDEDSKLQSWIILGINFHQQHHNNSRQAYYTYGATQGAPKLPADYALMVLACFVPALWRRIMDPVLLRWVASAKTEAGQSAAAVAGRQASMSGAV